jgi:acylglycerol lipase
MNHGAHIAKELANIGCIVVGFDHRGFGKSEGIRGYLESVPIHLHDSKEFVFRILSYYEN